jgi:hypothetical protein
MAQIPATAQHSQFAGLYRWLADREERAAAAGGALTDPVTFNRYDSMRRRLAAVRAGEPIDIYAGDLPPWARVVGVKVYSWTRAVVRPDGTVTLKDDDGSRWLEENGL